MAIQFFNEDIDFPDIDKRELKAWVKKVIESYSKKTGNLSYIFTSDSNILKINKEYLQHDYYTDVITFDYTEENKISGDIFISLDTVKSNSIKFNQDYTEELNRVIIHGVLHLIGFKDKTETEAAEMRKREELSLSILKYVMFCNII